MIRADAVDLRHPSLYVVLIALELLIEGVHEDHVPSLIEYGLHLPSPNLIANLRNLIILVPPRVG